MAENKSNRTGMVVGIIALVLACTVLGTLGGAVAGGAAGYFMGRRAVGLPADSRGFRWLPEMPTPRAFGQPTPQPRANVQAVAQVETVTAGSPAEKAGLRAGDLVTAVDGRPLTANRDLAQVIARYRPGDQVELTLGRGGQQQTVKVTLGPNPSNADQPYLGVTYRMTAGAGSGLSQ